MTDIHNVITDNIDLWTSAIKKRNATGRGSSKKIELTGIKKLRELILELAVRGKLVPQDPNDEPASVLLEKIAEEKDQLIKDKKIKKQKTLSAITKEEKSFKLPKAWEWVRLQDSIDVRDGTHDSPKDADSGETYPLVTSKDFKAGNINFETARQISAQDHFEISKRSLVEVDDILFSMIGGNIGNQVIVKDERPFSIKNVALFKYYDKEATAPYYFKIYTENLAIALQESAIGGAQPFISLGALRKLVFALPPLTEQHRIVAKVDELMALCDELEQQTEQSLSAHQTLVEVLLATLTDSTSADDFQSNWQRISEHFDALFTTEHSIEQLKQTILQLAVMGKLVPQNPSDEPASKLLEKIAEEKAQLIKDKKIKKQTLLPVITDEKKPFEIPNGWSYTRLDDLCANVFSGSTPPKSELNETSGIPFLKVYNIQNQELEFEQRTLFVSENSHTGKLKRSILYPGDVILNLVGPPLGKVAIMPNTYPEWNCNQNIICFRPLEIKLNRYIYTYLKAHIFLDYIDLVGSAGQDFISGAKCRAIVLPMPPLAEQHRIVAKVDELMALCDQLKTRLADAQTTQLHLADAVVESALSTN